MHARCACNTISQGVPAHFRECAGRDTENGYGFSGPGTRKRARACLKCMRGHVFMHPDHYFGSPKPWFFDTRFDTPKRVPENHVFGTRKHPSGGWFFGPCFGTPPGTPKTMVQDPQNHGPETPISDPCLGTENRPQNHGFRAQNHGFGLQTMVFDPKQPRNALKPLSGMGRTLCFGQIAGRKALIARGFFGIPPKQPQNHGFGPCFGPKTAGKVPSGGYPDPL